MSSHKIAGADHICRYVGASQIHPEDGAVDGSAFRIRKAKDEKYLSVDWLEYFGAITRVTQIVGVRAAHMKKNRNLRAQAIFAVLNVGQATAYVRKESTSGCNLSFVNFGEDDDPSHSGIFGYSGDDQEIEDLIADCVIDRYPAKEGTLG